ncbi:MAG: hypothetical protein KGO49_07445 [Gammaproteobacteria bacterium]|nr:hypothetical protein [Gammaproteobacteria bacterium]
MTDGIILIVFSVILLLALAILTNALSDDAGFVLMVWHQQQVITTVGFGLLMVVLLTIVLIALFFIFRTVLFGSEYLYQKRKAKTRRKTLMSLDTAIRHRLVADDAGSFLAMEDSLTNNSLNLRPFNKKKGSALHLLQADVACRAGLYTSANEHLTHIDSDDHELATLLRVKICLASGDFLQAKSALELLLIYPEQSVTEPIRESLQPHFDRQVGALWSQLAAQIPWQMLSQSILPAQQYIDWNLWLQALLTHEMPEQAMDEISRLLLLMTPEMQDQYADALFAVLIRAHADQRAFALAEHILSQRLDVALLSRWMSASLAHTTDEDVAQSVDRVLMQLEQRYPAQPDVVLARVRWLRAGLKSSAQSEQMPAVLDQLSPFQNHPLIQHYQLLWQVEDHSDIDDHFRTALLDNLSQ